MCPLSCGRTIWLLLISPPELGLRQGWVILELCCVSSIECCLSAILLPWLMLRAIPVIPGMSLLIALQLRQALVFAALGLALVSSLLSFFGSALDFCAVCRFYWPFAFPSGLWGVLAFWLTLDPTSRPDLWSYQGVCASMLETLAGNVVACLFSVCSGIFQHPIPFGSHRPRWLARLSICLALGFQFSCVTLSCSISCAGVVHVGLQETEPLVLDCLMRQGSPISVFGQVVLMASLVRSCVLQARAYATLHGIDYCLHPNMWPWLMLHLVICLCVFRPFLELLCSCAHAPHSQYVPSNLMPGGIPWAALVQPYRGAAPLMVLIDANARVGLFRLATSADASLMLNPLQALCCILSLLRQACGSQALSTSTAVMLGHCVLTVVLGKTMLEDGIVWTL